MEYYPGVASPIRQHCDYLIIMYSYIIHLVVGFDCLSKVTIVSLFSLRSAYFLKHICFGAGDCSSCFIPGRFCRQFQLLYFVIFMFVMNHLSSIQCAIWLYLAWLQE